MTLIWQPTNILNQSPVGQRRSLRPPALGSSASSLFDATSSSSIGGSFAFGAGGSNFGSPRGVSPRQSPRTSPRRDQSPMSARQRKQIFMHSSLFDEGGPSSQSRYSTDHQSEILDRVQANSKRAGPPDMTLPSARDMRATMNLGHDVVTPLMANGTAQGKAEHGEGLVLAGAQDTDRGALPHEVWATSTNLHWLDPRNEILTHRAKVRRSHSAMNARDKVQHLNSSELFDSVRHDPTKKAPNFPRTPRSELRAVGFQNAFAADSRRDHHVDPTQRERSGDHRARKGQNLEVSDESQFSRGPPTNGASPNDPVVMPETPPQSSRQITRTVSADAGDGRRRSEKNYSDLFGMSLPERQQGLVKCDVGCSAIGSVFDHRSEVASVRGRIGQSAESPRRRQEKNFSDIFHENPPTSPRLRGDVHHAHKVSEDERPCWETRMIMDTNAEVARRVRERMLVRKLAKEGDGVREEDLDGSKLTASERMMRNMGSSQVRVGTGANAAKWDDRSAEDKRMTRMRSAPNSPMIDHNIPRAERDAGFDRRQSRLMYMEKVLQSDHFPTYRTGVVWPRPPRSNVNRA